MENVERQIGTLTKEKGPISRRGLGGLEKAFKTTNQAFQKGTLVSKRLSRSPWNSSAIRDSKGMDRRALTAGISTDSPKRNRVHSTPNTKIQDFSFFFIESGSAMSQTALHYPHKKGLFILGIIRIFQSTTYFF